jgi:hypothetical protein
MPPEEEMLRMEKVIGHQAKGAIFNGRRVKKVNSEPEDRTPDGREGTVRGSIANLQETIIVNGQAIQFGYLVEWDNDKDYVVFVNNNKLEEL